MIIRHFSLMPGVARMWFKNGNIRKPAGVK